MLVLIVKKELLRRLRDLRFMLLLAISTILAVAAAITFRGEYERGLRDYAAMAARARQQTNLEEAYLVKPPTPLGFINMRDWNFTNQVRLEPKVLYYQTTDVTGQPVIEGSPRLDWLFIFVYVFGFFAIILTYDTVAGEKEFGTLRLMLANPCSRSTIILGALMGNILSLWIPLLMVALISLLVIAVGGPVQFAPQDWARIGLAALISALFVAVMGMLGILASAIFHRAASALIAALLFWTILTIIIPSGAGVAAEYFSPIPSPKELNDKLWALEMEKQQNLGISGITLLEIISQKGLTEAERRERLAAKQAEMNAERERFIESFPPRVAALLDSYFNQLSAQANLMRTLSQISPPSAYEYALEEILPSGYERQRIFIESARRYLSDYTQIAESLRRALRDKAQTGYSWTELDYKGSTYRLEGLSWISYANVPVDENQFPKFQMLLPDLKSSLRSALWHIAILMIFGAAIFAATYFLFLVYDPR